MKRLVFLITLSAMLTACGDDRTPEERYCDKEYDCLSASVPKTGFTQIEKMLKNQIISSCLENLSDTYGDTPCPIEKDRLLDCYSSSLNESKKLCEISSIEDSKCLTEKSAYDSCVQNSPKLNPNKF